MTTQHTFFDPPASTETGLSLPAGEAWAAVSRRDRRYDGAFVLAVSTTGIYCRPSCPARRPRRENVSFFATPEAAEAAGYRACLRCRPADPGGLPAEQAVASARAYLDARLDENVTLKELAGAVGFSSSHMQRIFKEAVGLSPKKYQEARRLEAFKERARAGDTVLEATYEAGFGSSNSLYAQAENGLGMTPGTYRRGGAGLHIRFAVTDSAFGRVLVAATERGVCAVMLGEDDEALAAELETEFPQADHARDDDALRIWIDPVVQYLAGQHQQLAVPVDLQGTDFQRRVWRALQQIPYGETRSYEEVAATLGKPSATRAVAQACARNKVALVVPCHRVVCKDGSVSGYRWGPARKRRLLALEKADDLFAASGG